jgi:hypothetical protein
MAVTLHHAVATAAALLALAAACADASTTFYSSDPNLGFARVVFQVTGDLPPSVPVTVLTTARSAQCVWPRIRSKRRFLLVSGGETGEHLKFVSSVDGLGMVGGSRRGLRECYS